MGISAPDPMVLLDLPYSRDYFRAIVAASDTAPDVRYRRQSYETVRSLVAQGLGYSILNQRPRTSQTYGGGEVVALDLHTDRSHRRRVSNHAHATLDWVLASAPNSAQKRN